MSAATRPPVVVIVPFAGGADAARSMLASIGTLRRGPGDRILVVNNGAPGLAAPEGIQVLEDSGVRSSYYARNAGARLAEEDWILFIDGDCVPEPDLIDRYFEPWPGARAGAVAGAVVPLAGGTSLMERHARSRLLLDQGVFLARERPFAATANLLVRRQAWQALGGFREVRSGGDVDFSWRLQQAGWDLESRPEARVEHRHRDSLRSFLRQRSRYGGGAAWLAQQHPGVRPVARPVRGAVRSLIGSAGMAVRGHGEEAAFLAIDSLGYLAHAAGSRSSNLAA